ncbi:MAG: helix-turn-helix domain-containing protein [Candidatus Dojkabacteria bacterium]|jgi:cytoskeletal protein RodZ|nr:helix-turn-helix domain-containing protein [Candidatus Dojkabacteria bacterium]MDD2270250.1 helix-turn-helix domain-containing protein [Candidatus Dojkabacteria bacterium]
MITVGEVLKKQRENLQKTLEQAALDTKIQPRFLKYIENNDFDKFDSSVYAQGFIKIYAKYLDLNEDRLLAIYRRSVPNIKLERATFRETRRGLKNPAITPKSVAITLSAIFLLGIISYLGYQIYQFQTPPKIEITNPPNESSVSEESIDILGATDINSSLFINDHPVELNGDGSFQYQVTLNPGVNIITILAKKNNSTQESVETLKINYEVTDDTDTEEIVEPEEQANTVRLEIVNSSVWVQFNVDKVNKVSQIVQVGQKYEYEVENEFSLTTGIISSTNIYFNNKQVAINVNSSNIGSLNCEIINKDQINCE